MNYHNNMFPPRPPACDQWQHQSWNHDFRSNNNFAQRQPFQPFFNPSSFSHPMQGNNFNPFQNQRHVSPGTSHQYSQGGNRGGFGNFTGGPRVPAQRGRGGSFQGNHHHNNHQNHQNWQKSEKTKKKKVDKRDLAENNQYFCDTCDRGFKTEEKYDEHVGGHQQCSVSGCPYIAAPKLVQLHFQMQHKGDLAKKVWSMESQADVDNWIAERKKKYPTPSNMKKKEAELFEKKERGEVLETKQFGKFKRGTSENNSQDLHSGRDGGKFQRGRWGNKKQRNNPRQYYDRDESSESPQKRRHLDCRAGPTHTQSSNGGDVDMLNPHTEQEDSKDEGSNDKPAEISKLDSTDLKHSEGNAQINQEQITQDSFNGHEKNSQEVSSRSFKTRRRPHGNADGQNNQKKIHMCRKRITLLERLLAAEIRHERNVVLQCVYYIVKKNFFSKKTSEISKTVLAAELKRANNSNSDTCCNSVSDGLPSMDLGDELQRADNSCNGTSPICENQIEVTSSEIANGNSMD